MTRSWLIATGSLVGFLIASYFLIIYGLPLFLPFAVALIAAELMDPIVSLLMFRGRVPRSIAVTIILMLFVGLITTAFTVAVARLVLEIQSVITNLPETYSTLLELSERYAEQFGTFRETLPQSVQDLLETNLASMESTVSKSLESTAKLLGTVTSVPAFLANTLVAIIATFFISRDRRQIGNFLLSLFPRALQPGISQVKNEVWSNALGFARAQLTLILMTMVQTIIGLALIGSNYALLMGVIVGVADLMPLLGPAAVFIPWILYSFLMGSTSFGLKLLILYVIVAGVRQVLEPKVVGEQLGLHPLTILLSIYLGFQFFGALGFVVGPLMAILLKAMIRSGLLPDHSKEIS